MLPDADPVRGIVARVEGFSGGLARRWFALVRDGDPELQAWFLRPSRVEQEVLAAAERDVLAAVLDLAAPNVDTPVGERPALLVQRYLLGFASAVADAMGKLGGAGVVDLPTEPAGPTDTMAVAAGLLAGAAAAKDVAGPGRAGALAAELAHRAGLTAAELAVTGADLPAVTAAAAAIVVDLRSRAEPLEATGVDRRAVSWICLLLVALARAARPPEPAVAPAPCGATPGQRLGSPFAAEVTFVLSAEDTARTALLERLGTCSDDVTVWPRAGMHAFHVHTHSPGEVVSEAYAHGTVFELGITALR